MISIVFIFSRFYLIAYSKYNIFHLTAGSIQPEKEEKQKINKQEQSGCWELINLFKLGTTVYE